MKPLLFIEPLYNQTIKGLKTMTRREGSLKAINDNPDDWSFSVEYRRVNEGLVAVHFFNSNGHNIILKPRLLVGDICRLNEPYFETNWGNILYKFDNDPETQIKKWKNKMFMPADAARRFVKVTGVKCERLLDISDEDCIAEGIETNEKGAEYGFKYYLSKNPSLENLVSPCQSFLSLFKFANKIKADAPIKNIWVWVYSYVLCDKDGKEITNEH